MFIQEYSEILLLRRDDDSGSGYGYIAFIPLVFCISMVSLCFTNARRIKRGRPALVSSVLAPPSYFESERQQRNHHPDSSYNNRDSNAESVPLYTADVNPNQDVGYYDINGNLVTTEQHLLQKNQEQQLRETEIEESSSSRRH